MTKSSKVLLGLPQNRQCGQPSTHLPRTLTRIAVDSQSRPRGQKIGGCHGFARNVGRPVTELEGNAIIAPPGREIYQKVIIWVAGAWPPVKVNDAVAAASSQHIEHASISAAGRPSEVRSSRSFSSYSSKSAVETFACHRGSPSVESSRKDGLRCERRAQLTTFVSMAIWSGGIAGGSARPFQPKRGG